MTMMNIHIMGYRQAIRYVPRVPTVAIRIFDSYPDSLNSPRLELQDSPFFRTLGYVFDDQDSDWILQRYPAYDLKGVAIRNVLFDEMLARKMLEDFAGLKDGCLDLLVHCTIGACRSPAVAMALNEVFELGQDSQALKDRYPTYNRFVYRLLKEASETFRGTG